MYFGSGHALSEKMFGAKTVCRNCKKRIHFSDAERLARESGITDNVIMCAGCRHVYTYMLIPGNLALDMDVTERYSGIRTREPDGASADAPEEEAPRKKKGFRAKLRAPKE